MSTKREEDRATNGAETDAVSVDSLMIAPAQTSGAEKAPEVSGLVAIVEALVFASPEPITQKQLFKLLDTARTARAALASETLALPRSGGRREALRRC